MPQRRTTRKTNPWRPERLTALPDGSLRRLVSDAQRELQHRRIRREDEAADELIEEDPLNDQDHDDDDEDPDEEDDDDGEDSDDDDYDLGGEG